jgi:hypothetical protein
MKETHDMLFSRPIVIGFLAASAPQGGEYKRGTLYTTRVDADQPPHTKAWCMDRPSFLFSPFRFFPFYFFLFQNVSIFKSERISICEQISKSE